jgi:hypothetical protein
VARQGGASEPAGVARRVGVFVDYWYAYTSARQLFATPGTPPPPWFGNVSPRALAGAVVKRPPAGARRSERELKDLHLFVRHFDPDVHRSQLDRVRRWELEGATVSVGPSPDQGGGHWQSSVSVALATAVVDGLARGVYDTAVVFAGDGSLWPMFERLRGTEAPSATVELVTWVAPDGTVPTSLTAVPGVWCHRLGEATFKQMLDDRRPSHHTSAHAARAMRLAGTRRPDTAMAAALAAAGLAPGAAASTGEAPPVPDAAPAENVEHAAEVAAPEEARGVRRISRLFGRGGA